MKIILGLTFLLITSSHRSNAQDDSLAGSFLSGTNQQRQFSYKNEAKCEPYLLLLNKLDRVLATIRAVRMVLFLCKVAGYLM